MSIPNANKVRKLFKEFSERTTQEIIDQITNLVMNSNDPEITTAILETFDFQTKNLGVFGLAIQSLGFVHDPRALEELMKYYDNLDNSLNNNKNPQLYAILLDHFKRAASSIVNLVNARRVFNPKAIPYLEKIIKSDRLQKEISLKNTAKLAIKFLQGINESNYVEDYSSFKYVEQPVCDLCNRDGKWPLVSSKELKNAVKNGFNPHKLGLLPFVSPEEVEFGFIEWSQFIAQENKPWAICDECMQSLKNYLISSKKETNQAIKINEKSRDSEKADNNIKLNEINLNEISAPKFEKNLPASVSKYLMNDHLAECYEIIRQYEMKGIGMKTFADALSLAEQSNNQELIDAILNRLKNSEFYSDGKKTYSILKK